MVHPSALWLATPSILHAIKMSGEDKTGFPQKADAVACLASRGEVLKSKMQPFFLKKRNSYQKLNEFKKLIDFSTNLPASKPSLTNHRCGLRFSHGS